MTDLFLLLACVLPGQTPDHRVRVALALHSSQEVVAAPAQESVEDEYAWSPWEKRSDGFWYRRRYLRPSEVAAYQTGSSGTPVQPSPQPVVRRTIYYQPEQVPPVYYQAQPPVFTTTMCVGGG